MACAANGICIGNTFFKHKSIHKKTWRSPDGHTRNEIDYICISRRWRTSLRDVRAYRGADVGSDHYLIIGVVQIKLKRQQKSKGQQPINIRRLSEQEKAREYKVEIANRFAESQQEGGLEEQWAAFKNTTLKCAEEIIGRRRGSLKERWISDATWELIDERKSIKIKREQAQNIQDEQEADLVYRELDKAVKKSCKKDKKRWIEDKGQEAQQAADRNDTRTMYRIVRELTGSPSCNARVPIKDKNGKRLLTNTEQDER